MARAQPLFVGHLTSRNHRRIGLIRSAELAANMSMGSAGTSCRCHLLFLPAVSPDSNTQLQTVTLQASHRKNPLQSPEFDGSNSNEGMGYAISYFFLFDFRGHYHLFAAEFADSDRRRHCFIGMRRPSHLYGPGFFCGRDHSHERAGITAGCHGIFRWFV
jgi:hypothetical protein